MELTHRFLRPEMRRLEEQLLLAPSQQLWEQARSVYKSSTPPSAQSLLIYGLASVLCFNPGELRFDKGQELLRQVARRFEAQGQFAEAALARVYLARAEGRRGRLEARLQLLREAVALAHWASDGTLVARTLHELALGCVDAGRLEEAEQPLVDLAGATNGQASEERWRWHHLRARLLELEGDLRLAARELSKAWTHYHGPEPSEGLEMLQTDAKRLKAALERVHEPQAT